ncbi:acyl-CoA synthetase [Plasticicumulans acidivorans]|uniref:Fatty-acyl-CoA synthase n=1 Tax=Plasticicumulans acidivorans TaxID=886464 RepID=A0A317MTY2_9GAMM|nr:acyl-CoA synthetase [Plasticicumulans acidivorans]PWV61085.1 fatty-acyl-CoA synthase [Plasticicumulans acidivorans]
MQNPYELGLDRNAANFVNLSPLSFIERTASIYPERLAVVHGDTRRSWGEVFTRCRKLASALNKRGIGLGDTVAIMLPNIPEMLEVHFGVPASGAVLNTLNVRLDADAIAFMLQHGQAKLVITDREFSDTVKKALRLCPVRPIVIDVDDLYYEGGELLGEKNYEAFLEEGDADFEWKLPDDEWQAISLNYTSGTTGNPKGVVYHHRGAYLNGICNIVAWDMGKHPVYLWTLPMFHCNGWCFPWTLAAAAGTSVCLRAVRPEPIFKAIKEEKVNHFCGAPIVLNMLNNSPAEMKAGITHLVKVMVAGAAPPAAVIEGMERMGFNVTHVYGLTETFGPCVSCVWQDRWEDASVEEKARLKARQGVRYPMQQGLMVADPTNMQPVPQDGKTLGEVFMRGNLVMKGYLKNPAASEEAFAGGWFHSGDLAVWHEDGYIEIKDRSKDIVISGGENISTIEVEDVLYRHPAVMEAAVVARPDAKWGETPCAYVTLKPQFEGEVKEEEIIAFCKTQMAGYKVPRTIVFGPLPKTSTGKIQKFILRNQAKELGSLS